MKMLVGTMEFCELVILFDHVQKMEETCYHEKQSETRVKDLNKRNVSRTFSTSLPKKNEIIES